MSARRILGPMRAGLAALLVVAGLAACGGSGSTDVAGVGSGGTGAGPSPQPAPPTLAHDGVGTGGTGRPVPAGGGDPAATIPAVSKSLVAGAIADDTDFVVDGVLLDPRGATVVDAMGQPRGTADLRRGRVVEVYAVVDELNAVGVARSVRLISELSGAIGGLDAARGTFDVLGTPIRVTPDTVWGGVDGLGRLARGSLVEVWGFRDDTGAVVASRVDAVHGTSSLDPVTLRGEVTAADAAARTIVVSGQAVDLRRLAAVPAGMVPGATVQVVGTQAAPGQPVLATSIGVIVRAIDQAVVTAQVTGLVSRFSSLSRFELAGVPIDASSATWIGGDASMLRGGLRVTASGPVRGGRVVARWVSFVAVPFVPQQAAPSRDTNTAGAVGPASASSPSNPGASVSKPPSNVASNASSAPGRSVSVSTGGTASSGASARPESTGASSSGTGSSAAGASGSGLLVKRIERTTYVLALPAAEWRIVKAHLSPDKAPSFTVEHVRDRSLRMRVRAVRAQRD